MAVLPGLPPPADFPVPPEGNPARGGAAELDPVPTGVTFGTDGNLYVSLLSGGPFPPGATRIMRVTTGGQVSVAAASLTMLTDIKRGPDGNWYAVEFGQFGEQGPVPGSGNIVRITAGGQRQVVVGGLTLPNKIAFDRSGNLYATVNTLLPNGQVVRFNAADIASGALGGMPGMPRTGSGEAEIGAVLLLALLLAGGGAIIGQRYHSARF